MSRKLRLLHIGNGSAFKIKAILDAMLARGHEVHMVPIPPASKGFEGVTWHPLGASPLPGQAKVLHRMFQIRRLAQKLKPDVVHAHNAWGPGWYGAAIGLRPFVIHGYGGDLLPEQYRHRPALQRKLTSWACRTADRVVVTGQHMVGAAGHLGIDPDRVMLLPRGVDTRRYRPGLDVRTTREKLGLQDASPVIFSPRYQVDEALYNLDTIIEAFSAVRRQFPGAVCLQMYEPGRKQGVDALQALAAKHGLGDSYRMIPSVDNETMPLFYNLADVTVSVPSSDGFPVSVLEASACGSPLIVSDLPYCKDWFVPRENGLIVPKRDAGALAQAIGELCADPQLSRRMGAASRAQVEARADYERCMDQLEAMYFGLLRDRTSPRREAN